MKKSFFLTAGAICAGIAFLFCGCGDQDDDEVTEVKVLRVAMNPKFAPYSYLSGKEIVGIDVDIIREIAEKLGYAAEFSKEEFDAVIPAVQAGRYELGAGGISVTDERKEQVAFTVPYVRTTQLIVVPKNSPITASADLKKKEVRVGVQRGTTGEYYVAKKLQTPERFGDAEKLFAALAEGKIDAAVCDGEVCRVYVSGNAKLQVLPIPLNAEEYAFVFDRKNEKLLQSFNEELLRMRNSGRLRQIMDAHFQRKVRK